MTKHLPKGAATAALAAVLSFGLISTASAAPLVYLSVEDLARRSDGCALARVVDARVHWNEAHTLIVTTFTLDVEESFSGNVPAGPVTLHRVGGELDGLALGYQGMPELAVGDRSVVFVQERAPSVYIVSSLQQGVLREENGVFARDLHDVVAAPAHHETVPLGELRTRVRAAIGDRR